MYLDIQTLLQIMKIYKTADKVQLLKEANLAKEETHKQQLKDLIRSNQWNTIYRKAQEEYNFIQTLQDNTTSYCHTFMTDVDDSLQQ